MLYAGLNITLRNLKLKLQMDLRKNNNRLTDVCISGCVGVGMVDLKARFLLKCLKFQVFHIQLVNQLSFSCLLEQICNGWSASSLAVAIKEGHFYYAREDIEFSEDGKLWKYQAGYHIECVITLINSDFRIKTDISHDRSELTISGRSIEKIDFGFAKLTGMREYLHEGPELRYTDRTLSLLAGVEIFKEPWFEGELGYCFRDRLFKGTITYLGRILWIKNPKMTVQWSKKKGFEIVHFPILDDIPGFDFLGAIAKCAKVLYNLISGHLRWGFQLSLTTGENPDPNKYLLKLILKGDITVTVLGFINCELIPLPDIPLRIPKVDNFSFGRLPEYIAKCLWESAGDICKSLLNHLNPFELAKQMGKRILDAVTEAISTVIDIGKKVCKKVWGWCKSIFGFSAFIFDSDSSSVLGYIYAGKGGREFCNIEYIVNNFGPYLAVHALGEVARDIHRNANACINAQGVNQDEEPIRNKLGELKKHTRNLSSSLQLAADEILTVRNIKAEISNNQIYVEWEACNESGEIVFNRDKGDIEHHLTVTVTTIHLSSSRSTPEIKTEEVYGDYWTPLQTKKESDVELTEKQPNLPQEQQSEVEKVIRVHPKGLREKETEIIVKSKVDYKDETDSEPEEVLKQSQEQAGNEWPRNRKLLQEVKSEYNVEGDHSETIKIESETLEKTNELQAQHQTYRDHELPLSKVLAEQATAEESSKKTETKNMFEQENRQSLEEKCPCTIINIDDTIFKHAVKFTISIQPKVTLRVMTPSDPIMVSQDVIDSGDKTWMTQIKKEIKETGREKEVTLCGRKVCKEFLTKLALDVEVLINSVTCQFCKTGEVATLCGMIQPVPGVKSYSIQVVDKYDLTIIVKEVLCSLEQDFQIHLTLKDLPDFSCGPYIVRVMAIGSNFNASQGVTIPELEIPRQTSPADLNLSHTDKDVINISWASPHECNHNDGDCMPFYKVLMLVTFTEDHMNNDRHSLSTDSAFINRVAPFEVPIPDDFVSKGTEMYECNVDLKDRFNLLKIPHETGALLEFKVTKYGPSKLPSQSKSVDFILVAPPKYITPSYPKEQPGLQLSWKSTTHTVSYLVEALNVKAPAVSPVFSKQYDHDKSMKSAFDIDALLDYNDLKGLSSGCCYKLQVHSLGFGEDLHQSLVPTVAIEELYVMSVQIEFLPKVDTILVRFDPCLAGFSYKVSLYKLLKGENPQIFESKYGQCLSNHSVVIGFKGYKKCWGVALGPDCDVLAWIHTPLSSPIQIGVSANKLQVLPSPPDITVIRQKQGSDLSINKIFLSWPKVSGVQTYQYGLYNAETGDVRLLRKTGENKADITFSKIELKCLSYISVKCFVRSEGNITTLTSDPVVVTSTYQCILTAMSKVVVYTSTLLHRVWSRYLVVSSFRNRLLIQGYKYLLLPHCTYFPDNSVSSRIWHKFWSPELPLKQGFFAGILSNGVYVYACDILEGVDLIHNKWKNIKLNSSTFLKPERWHTEIQLLLYIRYSVVCPRKRVKSLGVLDYELKMNATVSEDVGAKDTRTAAGKDATQINKESQKYNGNAEGGWTWLKKQGSKALDRVKQKWKSSRGITTYPIKKRISLKAERNSCASKGFVHLVRHIKVKSDSSISLKVSNSNCKESECKVNLFMRFV